MSNKDDIITYSSKLNSGPSNNSESSSKIIARAEAKLLTQGQASVLVLIINSETRACNNNLDIIKRLFSDVYFTVQVCSVAEPKEFPEHKTLTRAQYLENYNIRKVLAYAAEGPYDNGESQRWWTDLPVIIVKDSSVSHLTMEHITQHISTALKSASSDLFFLCSWQDACHKYRDVQGTLLKWSTKPSATQAIMYTPRARDHIRKVLLTSDTPFSNLLNNTVAQKKLSATVFVPNLIDFDINLATSNEDFNKLNACMAATDTNSSVDWSIAIWFIVMLILIILVAWAIIIY
jgi:hypothetical protein